MTTRLFILSISLIFIGCADNKQSSKAINNKTDPTLAYKSIKKQEYKRKDVDYYMSDTAYITWQANHPQTTQYLCEIIFHEEYANYSYNGQCGYSYFTDKTSDTTIDFYWSYKVDCISDMSFLEKANGLKHFPKRGDTFSTFTLINDSVMSVKYYFPEWVKRVNKIAKDSLFPTYF